MTECALCSEPSIMSINSTDYCARHLREGVSFQAELVAAMRGAPPEVQAMIGERALDALDNLLDSGCRSWSIELDNHVDPNPPPGTIELHP